MFYYTAFGLSIASEIEFPELLEKDQSEDVDVQIKIGSVPKTLKDEHLLRPNLWISPNQYLLHIKDSASFFSIDGNLIIVDPHLNANKKDIRLYLLCNAMAAIIHQRKLIPLHASGILTKKGVVLLIGDCGAGKSTTLKALVDKGHQIFTDDVCVLRNHKGKVEGIPSYPLIKLWENSYDLLQLGEIKEENRLWSDTNKFGVYFHDQFNSCWKTIAEVFLLEIDEGLKDPTIVKQNGTEAFKSIGKNTYGESFVEPMKSRVLHFQMVNELLRQCDVYKITRPTYGNTLSKVVELIEEIQ